MNNADAVLARLVSRLADDDLTRPSAADRWTVAQVLSGSRMGVRRTK